MFLNRFFLAIMLFFIVDGSFAQVEGRVMNANGEPLGFASILVKGSTIGVSANSEGYFRLQLAPGSYTLVCQHIGYETREMRVTVPVSEPLNFVLSPRQLNLSEVVVKSNGEDPAYAIIREAIKKRDHYHKQVDESVVEVYAKDVLRMRDMPRMLEKNMSPQDRINSGLDSLGRGIIYLHESISKVWRKRPDKVKVEVKSSRVSGSDGFGFSFPTVITLNTNNVRVFSERFNPRGFISPIADGALGYYRYKFLGNFFEDGRMIHSIQVTPRRKYEPLFSGILNITDDDWRIHSFTLTLLRENQLELLDTLIISQLHMPVDAEVWQPQNQRIKLSGRLLGFEIEGNFLNAYTDYSVNAGLDQKVFSNVLIAYDTSVTAQQKSWWDTIRPVPLSEEEKTNYQFRDSTFQFYKDSVNTPAYRDSLRKWQRGFSMLNLILPPGIHKRHYADSSANDFDWGLEPLLMNAEYNPAEGYTQSLIPYWRKRRGEKEWVVEPVLRYGFSNGHFNPSVNIEHTRKSRGRNRSYYDVNWLISGGKRVTQFNRENPIHPLMNSISTLFYGQNYMKTYENYFGSVRYERKGEKGLRWNLSAMYEDRLPLNNTTGYTVYEKYRERIQPNYPIELMNENFTRHQALVLDAGIEYQPGQRYIQFPNRKVSIGSRMPVFGFNYTRGLKMLGSDVDFDKWKLDVYDTRNLKLAGTIQYLAGVGGFINSKAVPVQDYQHFSGNLTTILNPQFGSFQLASYYSNSTTANFYVRGHLTYHLNGLITNKIPLFRKLKWHLVTGGNAFFVDKDRHYAEVFVGLENILKIFRVDFIAGYENGRGTLSEVKFGFGGIFADRARRQSQGRTRNSSLTLSF